MHGENFSIFNLVDWNKNMRVCENDVLPSTNALPSVQHEIQKLDYSSIGKDTTLVRTVPEHKIIIKPNDILPCWKPTTNEPQVTHQVLPVEPQVTHQSVNAKKKKKTVNACLKLYEEIKPLVQQKDRLDYSKYVTVMALRANHEACKAIESCVYETKVNTSRKQKRKEYEDKLEKLKTNDKYVDVFQVYGHNPKTSRLCELLPLLINHKKPTLENPTLETNEESISLSIQAFNNDPDAILDKLHSDVEFCTMQVFLSDRTTLDKVLERTSLVTEGVKDFNQIIRNDSMVKLIHVGMSIKNDIEPEYNMLKLGTIKQVNDFVHYNGEVYHMSDTSHATAVKLPTFVGLAYSTFYKCIGVYELYCKYEQFLRCKHVTLVKSLYNPIMSYLDGLSVDDPRRLRWETKIQASIDAYTEHKDDYVEGMEYEHRDFFSEFGDLCDRDLPPLDVQQDKVSEEFVQEDFVDLDPIDWEPVEGGGWL